MTMSSTAQSFSCRTDSSSSVSPCRPSSCRHLMRKPKREERPAARKTAVKGVTEAHIAGQGCAQCTEGICWLAVGECAGLRQGHADGGRRRYRMISKIFWRQSWVHMSSGRCPSEHRAPPERYERNSPGDDFGCY